MYVMEMDAQATIFTPYRFRSEATLLGFSALHKRLHLDQSNFHLLQRRKLLTDFVLHEGY